MQCKKKKQAEGAEIRFSHVHLCPLWGPCSCSMSHIDAETQNELFSFTHLSESSEPGRRSHLYRTPVRASPSRVLSRAAPRVFCIIGSARARVGCVAGL